MASLLSLAQVRYLVFGWLILHADGTPYQAVELAVNVALPLRLLALQASYSLTSIETAQKEQRARAETWRSSLLIEL